MAARSAAQIAALKKAQAASAAKRRAKAIGEAKKYGANKKRSAAATRNAYAKVSDADFMAIMRGDKKPYKPRVKTGLAKKTKGSR